MRTFTYIMSLGFFLFAVGMLYVHCAPISVTPPPPPPPQVNPVDGKKDGETDGEKGGGGETGSMGGCDSPNADRSVCDTLNSGNQTNQEQDLLQELKDKGFESVRLTLNREHLAEFQLGRAVNYKPDESWLFLKMKHVASDESEKHYYGGNLQISYRDQISKDEYVRRNWKFDSSTGQNNHLNKWKIRGQSDTFFYSYFSDEPRGRHKTRTKALILTITKIQIRSINDNVKCHTGTDPNNEVYSQCKSGSGSVWFMSFKTGGNLGNNACKDGIYVFNSVGSYFTKTSRCWDLSSGPFSCLATFDDNNHTPKGDTSCYHKIGDFKDLPLDKAFDQGGIDDNGILYKSK